MRSRFALALLAATSLVAVPAAAQKREPTPEQRIDRLEKQVRQVQKRVFPKGQPADTAGVVDDPAVTQSALDVTLRRLDAVERQMADLVRATEENGNRLSVMEADLARLRADADRRLRAVERGAGSGGDGAADSGGEAEPAPPPAPQPKFESGGAKPDTSAPTSSPAAIPAPTGNADVDAEAAYDAGYQLWNAGKHDQAISALQAMAKKYPDHRRASWAYNLAGRAMLDKGQYRAAAEALLANYRRDPKGERAQDSLFYLGQALVKLKQPGQACKAYAELEDVYGATLRAPLRQSLPAAKAEAKCN